MQGIMGCSEAISTDTKFKSRLNLNNTMLLTIYTHTTSFYNTTIPIFYSVLSPNLHCKHNKSFALLELETQIITHQKKYPNIARMVHDFQSMHPCMHSRANVTHNPLRHLIQFVCSGFLLTFSNKKMRRNEIRQERFMARHSGMR